MLERDDPKFEDNLAVATSDRTDLEKMERLGLGRLDTGDRPDIFDGFFKDHSIDIRTGELLGRYIAEERGLGPTSAQLLRAAEGRGVAGGDGPTTWPGSRTRSTRCAEPSRSSARSCAPSPWRRTESSPNHERALRDDRGQHGSNSHEGRAREKQPEPMTFRRMLRPWMFEIDG